MCCIKHLNTPFAGKSVCLPSCKEVRYGVFTDSEGKPPFPVEEILLDNTCCLCYTYRALKCNPYRGVEQLEARRAHNPEVVGSSPASATIKTPDFERNPVFF